MMSLSGKIFSGLGFLLGRNLQLYYTAIVKIFRGWRAPQISSTRAPPVRRLAGAGGRVAVSVLERQNRQPRSGRQSQMRPTFRREWRRSGDQLSLRSLCYRKRLQRNYQFGNAKSQAARGTESFVVYLNETFPMI